MLLPDTENTLWVAQYTMTLFNLCFDFEIWWFVSHRFCELRMFEFWIWERLIFELDWFELIWFWLCVFCNYWLWWLLLFWLGSIGTPAFNISTTELTSLLTNCFCFPWRMVDWQKVLSLISSHDHCHRFSPSQICDMLQLLQAALVKIQMSAGSISIKKWRL